MSPARPPRACPRCLEESSIASPSGTEERRERAARQCTAHGWDPGQPDQTHCSDIFIAKTANPGVELPCTLNSGGFGYTPAFLEAGTYDLAIYDTTAASVVSAPTSFSPTPIYTGVTVLSAKDTTENISLP
ncbi:MAG: hypothetical protein M0001_06395 [Treponema sp.]|nr:hypothetical protein [Treponema sp.]